jgi:hypothetical protein
VSTKREERSRGHEQEQRGERREERGVGWRANNIHQNDLHSDPLVCNELQVLVESLTRLRLE